MKLTNKIIAALPVPAKGRKYHRDDGATGLAVCITANGSRVFYRLGRISGKSVFVKIGSFPGITVEQSRILCREINVQAARGVNPNTAKQTSREIPTLGSIFGHWLSVHAKPRRKSWETDERRYKRYLSVWDNRKLSELTKGDISAWHAAMGEQNGKPIANRVLSLLACVLTVADELGYHGKNPASGIKKFTEQSRERFLQPFELPKFFESLNQEKTDWQDFFLLLLLTGVRRSNLQAARWDEFQFDNTVWQIDHTKSGKRILAHVPEKAIEILNRRLIASQSEWVFPAKSKVGYLTDVKSAWKRIVNRAGIKNLTPHDCRRSFASWQAIGGSSLQIVGKSLGHSSTSATAIYARLTDNVVMESVNRAADAMMEFSPSCKP
jgi:integrase